MSNKEQPNHDEIKDTELTQFFQDETRDSTTESTDIELDEFLDQEQTNQYSSSEVDDELDLYFENEQQSPWQALKGDDEAVHIGIDSEYIYNAEENRNDILSYQYYLILGEHHISDVVLTPVAEVIKKSRAANKSRDDELKAINKVKKPRKKFEEFLVDILQAALGRGFIKGWPKTIYIYAHYLRADMVSFEAFWDTSQKAKLEVVRSTLTSTRGTYGIDLDAVGRTKQASEPVHFTDKHGKKRESRVRFVDTMLLSPGQSGLDNAGELIGIKKEVIPKPYRKDRMDELLVADEPLFLRYALRDAEITVKYGLEMQRFALKDIKASLKNKIPEDRLERLQFRHLPSTLGNFSVSLFKSLTGDKEALNQALGKETKTIQYWNQTQGRVMQKKETVITAGRRIFEQLSIDCFHGGRNECYVFAGSDTADYNDFDLATAYVNALMDIKPVNFEKSFTSTSINDYLGHKMGFAYVKFRFPENTKFPSLPVRTDLYGLYYPLEGYSYCTAPELEVAHNMECDIEIQFGVIVPWIEDAEPLFKGFTQLIREQRQKYTNEGDKFREKLWKEIGNTLYGKLGQGLKGKRGFNSLDGLSKNIPHSPVTNPYFAAHATGFVRAVLSEQLAGIHKHYGDDVTVVSATTDGYLVDCTEEQLHVSGTISQRFSKICKQTGDGKMIKHKHHAKQIIAMKTRGQITGEYGNTEPVIAKAGVKPPESALSSAKDENAFMVELFLDRYPGQKIPNNSLISPRDMYLKDMDLIEIQREKTLNLEFDFKRRPVNPRMTKIRHPKGHIVEHIYFDTVPWKNEQEGQQTRALFDGWRRGNCLKTMEDWDNWIDYSKTKPLLKGSHIKYEEDGSHGVLLKLTLRALSKESYGLTRTIKGKKLTIKQITAMFHDAGFEIADNAINNSRQSEFRPNVLAATPRLIPLLSWLKETFPDMEIEHFFHEDELNEALTMLKAYR
ncbi:DNA-directed DNA polymerase [Vibrio parahaemolyticus]|nr:DNA-directed DNA polymerase [Vibrio parahaemolyticus]MDF5500513.1 DNA-directed DNA polymerase [Vibrio parahaemolyticus]MDF5511247.1 DNA-directed DNA polymerase [Vibrio parahaemolyticus]MDF5558880.1 DNA-directed DNA polymerase [Vibrio parahaemolyticus]